jgi:hypothetical protein
MLNEGNHMGTQFYIVSVRIFVITFYYGYGSATAKSYGSYGSGSDSATLLRMTDLHRATWDLHSYWSFHGVLVHTGFRPRIGADDKLGQFLSQDI